MRFLTTFVVLAATACAPTPPPVTFATPSGRPEVIIEAPKNVVRERLVAYLLDQRTVILTNSDNLVVAGWQMDPPAPRPTARIRYDLLTVPTGTRVVGQAIVEHAYEMKDETNGPLGTWLQNMLFKIQIASTGGVITIRP